MRISSSPLSVRRVRLALTVAAFLSTLSPLARTQTPQSPSLTGTWLVNEDFFGTPRTARLVLEQQGDKLTGTFANTKIEGGLTAKAFQLSGLTSNKDELTVRGTFFGTGAAATFSATLTVVEAAHPEHPYAFALTGVPMPTLQHEAPQRHEFTPTVFYRQFSALNKPVLTVNPGDTIHTTTVDAGGTDEKGYRRAQGGNPQTGPFYIQGAMPGDVLAVHVKKLRLNRDWASSDDNVVRAAQNSDLAVRVKDTGKEIIWHLDREKGIASPEKPSEHLAHFSIPLKPMLGCIAVAPNMGQAAPSTGDSGFFGGNMDFNEITEGATVYLTVSNPGALLYFGDGHAAQGDGELTGNALETSMDVEITVDVLPKKRIGDPRVETPEYIITMGLDGSLDEALKEATSDMAQWLAEEYKLTPSEIAQVLGTAAEYKVSEIADRNVGLVLKLRKQYLQPLGSPPK